MKRPLGAYSISLRHALTTKKDKTRAECVISQHWCDCKWKNEHTTTCFDLTFYGEFPAHHGLDYIAIERRHANYLLNYLYHGNGLSLITAGSGQLFLMEK